MFFNLLATSAAENVVESATDSVATASSSFDWAALWATIVQWMASTGIKIVIAILLMIIGFKIVDVFTKRMYKKLQKRNADVTLSKVGTQALRSALKLLILICLIGYVGIETASVSAVIASLGVGISLAVQGTLSNFAGGVLLIVMRPFHIGDFITSGDQSGTVEDIRLFYTHIVTTDNRAVVIPNGTLANNVIINASAKETRRCDITVSAAYGSDTDLVKEVIRKVCEGNELIFKDPTPFVEMSDMASSSLDFVVRAWCKREDYWTVHFYLLENIKKAFDENGIAIPFNQLDVTIKNPQIESKSNKAE